MYACERRGLPKDVTARIDSHMEACYTCDEAYRDEQSLTFQVDPARDIGTDSEIEETIKRLISKSATGLGRRKTGDF